MKDKAIRTLVQGLVLSLMPAAAALAGPVNVNSADATTLARELDGIGPAKAQAIVEYRQQNGRFAVRTTCCRSTASVTACSS
jgi:competence protein ComEA